MTLPDLISKLHRALEAERVPHAFGGALALAYWTLEPRGTRDIDLNVFLPSAQPGLALRALPRGVEQPDGTAEEIEREGQIRLWWEGTPVDLFFDYVPVHAQAARHAQAVPFAGGEIPVLGPVELATFKAMFDRTRDWADIEAMIAAGTLDLAALRRTLRTMVADDGGRFARIEEAERRATREED